MPDFKDFHALQEWALQALAFKELQEDIHEMPPLTIAGTMLQPAALYVDHAKQLPTQESELKEATSLTFIFQTTRGTAAIRIDKGNRMVVATQVTDDTTYHAPLKVNAVASDGLLKALRNTLEQHPALLTAIQPATTVNDATKQDVRKFSGKANSKG